MARIAGVDLPRNKRVEIALTYIYGIGRNLARGILNQAGVSLDLKSDDLSDDEVRERLMAVEGIGPWSADMFLLRELGRPDVLPSEDVGVRKAVQRAYGLPAPPTPA